MALLSTNATRIGIIATFAFSWTMELSFALLSFLSSFAFLATFALLELATRLSATILKRNPTSFLTLASLSSSFVLALADLVHAVNLHRGWSIVGIKSVLNQLEVGVT